MDAPKLHLDPAVIAELRELMGGDLTALADSFTVDSRRRLDAIAGGLKSGDAETARAEAHSLNGAASSIGAHDLASLCGGLEQRIRAGEVPAPALLQVVEAECRSVCNELALLAVSGC